MLHEKIRDQQLPFYYTSSIYNWLELGAPKRLLQKFHFQLSHSEGYRDSSFARWGDGDIQVMQPLALHQVGVNNQHLSYFDDTQFDDLGDKAFEPTSEFEKLIWKFIHETDSFSINDVSLYTADVLLSSIRHMNVFLYTPMVIYIIRKILRMN